MTHMNNPNRYKPRETGLTLKAILAILATMAVIGAAVLASFVIFICNLLAN